MEENRKAATMAVPSEKSFSLTKVKLGKTGGLEVQYEVTETIDGSKYVNNYHVENGKDVHPDLLGLFRELRSIVARVFGVTSFLSLLEVEPGSRTFAPEFEDKARAFAEELLGNIDVRGVAFSGTGDNFGVIIMSEFLSANRLKSAVNTPRIKTTLTKFGFEQQLDEITYQIEHEVYAYLFLGKTTQLSLFGDE
jgi:hypothetical protein|nr:MAG TPA: hypothetical protein [Caudoviricetes sp.]